MTLRVKWWGQSARTSRVPRQGSGINLARRFFCAFRGSPTELSDSNEKRASGEPKLRRKRAFNLHPANLPKQPRQEFGVSATAAQPEGCTGSRGGSPFELSGKRSQKRKRLIRSPCSICRSRTSDPVPAQLFPMLPETHLALRRYAREALVQGSSRGGG
jgi:hypothetical protein